MRAFDEQMFIDRAEHRHKRVRIVELPAAIGIGCAQSIARAIGTRNQQALEETVGAALEFEDFLALRRYRRHALGMRHESADDDAVSDEVRPEQRKRIGMARGDERGDFVLTGLPSCRFHGVSDLLQEWPRLLRVADGNQQAPQKNSGTESVRARPRRTMPAPSAPARYPPHSRGSCGRTKTSPCARC